MTTLKGQIYLLMMSDNYQNSFYKIGRSIDFNKRGKSYNYSEILSIMKSDDIVYDESEIIKLFNKKCKLNKGREFFTSTNGCDYVLKLFLEYFLNKINSSIENIIAIPNTNIIENVSNIIEVVNNVIPDTNIVDNVVDNIVENIEKIHIDYICSNINCKKIFNYPSHLKIHLEKSYHCNKTIDNIDEYIQNIILKKKDNIVNNIDKNICIYCKKKYLNKFTLTRHLNTSQCNKEKYEKKIKIEILQKQIDELSK